MEFKEKETDFPVNKLGKEFLLTWKKIRVIDLLYDSMKQWLYIANNNFIKYI